MKRPHVSVLSAAIAALTLGLASAAHAESYVQGEVTTAELPSMRTPVPQGVGLSRADVVAELMASRQQGLMETNGEFGATPEVLAARDDYNQRQGDQIMARYQAEQQEQLARAAEAQRLADQAAAQQAANDANAQPDVMAAAPGMSAASPSMIEPNATVPADSTATVPGDAQTTPAPTPDSTPAPEAPTAPEAPIAPNDRSTLAPAPQGAIEPEAQPSSEPIEAEPSPDADEPASPAAPELTEPLAPAEPTASGLTVPSDTAPGRSYVEEIPSLPPNVSEADATVDVD